jgi:Mn-containing catalase
MVIGWFLRCVKVSCRFKAICESQGKLPGVPEFTGVYYIYYNMSQGSEPAVRGPWNERGDWKFVEDPQPAVDGGDGLASAGVLAEDVDVLQAMAARTASDKSSDPTTGADLGSGQATAV